MEEHVRLPGLVLVSPEVRVGDGLTVGVLGAERLLKLANQPGCRQAAGRACIINEVRSHVDGWRSLPNPKDWQVSPETARLLQHWRQHQFQSQRPFFCQVEAVETIIWLTEVAPKLGKRGDRFWQHVKGANEQANPELVAPGCSSVRVL